MRRICKTNIQDISLPPFLVLEQFDTCANLVIRNDQRRLLSVLDQRGSTAEQQQRAFFKTNVHLTWYKWCLCLCGFTQIINKNSVCMCAHTQGQYDWPYSQNQIKPRNVPWRLNSILSCDQSVWLLAQLMTAFIVNHCETVWRDNMEPMCVCSSEFDRRTCRNHVSYNYRHTARKPICSKRNGCDMWGSWVLPDVLGFVTCVHEFHQSFVTKVLLICVITSSRDKAVLRADLKSTVSWVRMMNALTFGEVCVPLLFSHYFPQQAIPDDCWHFLINGRSFRIPSAHP